DQRPGRAVVDVVLDQHVVLEHRDLGQRLALPDHHCPAYGLAPGQELGLAEDRGTAATRLPSLPASLPLGLQPGRTVDAGDGLVRTTTGGLVGVLTAPAAPPTPATAAARRALVGVVGGVVVVAGRSVVRGVRRVVRGVVGRVVAIGATAATTTAAPAATAATTASLPIVILG